MTDIHLKLWNLISFAEIPNRNLKKLADNLTKETEQYTNQQVRKNQIDLVNWMRYNKMLKEDLTIGYEVVNTF